MEIVLYEPEIPANTGNIGRTAVATGSGLHLIEPLGFLLNDRMIKRAGMDYWEKIDLHRYIEYKEFEKQHSGDNIWYVTTKAPRAYTEVAYSPGDYLMFGPESRGIPEDILKDHMDHCIRIPMAPGERSLNLSNAVSIVLYEALRQTGFMGLEIKGHLTT